MAGLEEDYMTQPNKDYRAGGLQDRLNPYRVATSLLLKRILWDLQPNSWVQRRKISRLRNQYDGEKAVIVCNGPSLKDIDFSLIEKEGIFTFGLNKINLIFNELSFRPSCIVSVNPLVIEQNASFYSSSDIMLFLDKTALKAGVKNKSSTFFLDSCDFPFFSRDCSISIFQGFTVTYVALQLAYHMGFSSVALIGCDHNYATQSGVPNSIVYNKNKDIAHFSEQYFKSDEPWQFPDLVASELYYDLARRCYEEAGRSIVNASTNSDLKIFERKSLDSFLNE